MSLGIKFSPDDLMSALEKIDSLTPDQLMSSEGLAAQADLEMEIRKLILSTPDERMKVNGALNYLKEIRGDAPPDNVLKFIRREDRRLRLSDGQIRELEQRQMGRCACCGTWLSKDSHMHADHVFPLMFGGSDSIENIELLCKNCNLGKGALIHWIMAAPWFSIKPKLSSQLRYCALRKFQSRCAEKGCENSSKDSELEVTRRIPAARGGKLVFDNLHVLCREHRTKRDRDEETHALRSFGNAGNRKFSFNLK